jgi:hypothetical protein
MAGNIQAWWQTVMGSRPLDRKRPLIFLRILGLRRLHGSHKGEIVFRVRALVEIERLNVRLRRAVLA